MENQSATRPARQGRVFWGTAFIVVGALLLLGHFNVVNIEWESAWRYWPVVLILLGGALLAGSRNLKLVAVALAAMFAGLLLYGMWTAFWGDRLWSESEGQIDKEFSEPMDKGTERAALTFESGAGTFSLADTCSDLFSASTRTNRGTYSIETDRTGDDRRIRLRMENRRFVWGLGRSDNSAEMSLNPRPAWDLMFHVGAARLDADVRRFNVSRLEVKAGAADINVKLGSNAGHSVVKIECGASEVRIAVPESSGCEVRVHAPLSSTHLAEFVRMGDGTYRTDNFDRAESTITIEMDAGVSSLWVERY